MKAFEMTHVLRLGNRVVTWILSLGIPVGPMSILTVPGRTTRLPRSTPVALTPDADGWLLVAAYGKVDWVRNLQKAKEATITRKGTPIAVNSTELAPADAAPILRDLVATAGPITLRVVGPYFDTSCDAPLQAWEAESINHPVFRLTPRTHEPA